jgi:hypothetical protein
MVNESIPMDDDDDKKRKEINLNIITKTEKFEIDDDVFCTYVNQCTCITFVPVLLHTHC